GPLWAGHIPICGVLKIPASPPDPAVARGRRLKSLIDEAGLTQVQAASALGVDQGGPSKGLKGRQGLSPEMAERAAQMFGVRVGWLFFGEGDPAPGTAQAREEGRRAGLREAAEVILWLADSTGAPPAHVP